MENSAKTSQGMFLKGCIFVLPQDTVTLPFLVQLYIIMELIPLPPLPPLRRKVHPKKQSINAYIVFKEKEGAVNALARYLPLGVYTCYIRTL